MRSEGEREDLSSIACVVFAFLCKTRRLVVGWWEIGGGWRRYLDPHNLPVQEVSSSLPKGKGGGRLRG